ncbi:tetratricopeptide repeat protein [Sphingobium limneticum]|uniref:Tetratricopeptide repeat protein n=1 Tax=Sphingobium limneticum TaxID=1007511 RepID=A0A5J5IA45_9SPHN|nr:tetratricopeptide repeat protein [Sphingobium limneticum]KAA9019663.1 tetratricopeptide repeat protein [Sphingobium limneticum]KAA9032121.1 tetratricopeptide repeat protein [Sphingobium limneticum]
MRNALFATSAVLLAMAAPAIVQPAAAQNAPVEIRVDRLEKEMRAVQRKVFQAGTPIEAEITRPTTPTVAPGSPASTPIADLTARVGALESQLASITGQVEENSYKLRQLEAAFTKYKAENDARLAEPAPVAPAVSVPVTPTPTAAAPKPSAPKPAAAAPVASEARKAAVAAVERPDTGDAAGDAYNYGFRLWDAKFYPEAQGQLKATVEKYGSSPVASKAQNLLGRAYLDDGKPALASVAFYENYQKRPRGDRAADSLTYLGEALIQLKKPADACKVYQELEQVYGESLSNSLRGMMTAGRAKAKCS